MGLRRLQAAVKLLPDPRPELAIDWVPFQLDPSLPTPGVSKADRYAQKFGEARVQTMQAHLATVGHQLGIRFNFGGLVGNTRDAHRALELAKRESGLKAQNLVAEALFRMYFEEEKSPADPAVIEQALKEVNYF